MGRAATFLRRQLHLLLALVLFAQTLGLVHRVLHAPSVHPTAAQAEHDFGHDAGDIDCRLFDQLAHADIAFGTPAPAVAEARPLPPAAQLPAGRLAPQASGFLARGPPPSVRA
ncbi:hypothetical protein [Piscinibacter defluvii]|uniref:hypothetical protein n=1 Tax=Piscinibacter defluvii TaxID=1796922 RepID=UPI000FDD263C|nr:hypothetical protein [Piscinibacter defluvii]